MSTKEDELKFNWNVIRANRVHRAKSEECLKSMRAICMQQLAEEEATCCQCGQKTLKLNEHADGANPWAKIQCTYTYPDGIACGFQHTCGHAKPSGPALKM